MAETIRIAELASKISEELFSFFKWSTCEENDLNFECKTPALHFQKASEESNKTHPTDVVFHYHDPYLNKRVYFNTDLKSYADTSIKYNEVRDWLISLIKGTECARGSKEWKQRYDITGSTEIRGLLFVYNHDGSFKKSIYDFIHDLPKTTEDKRPKGFYIKDLGLPKDLKIHIIEPMLIDYMITIKHDISVLKAENKIPAAKNLRFFYPNKQLHKSALAPNERPATIEMICGPFLIITYDEFKYLDDDEQTLSAPRGNIIYYKGCGESPEEFMFLIETLMMFDLINENMTTRIRLYAKDLHSTAIENFKAATRKYSQTWGYSSEMQNIIGAIEINSIPLMQKIFCNKSLSRSETME
ncbi:hypothetical protein EGK59_13045 [Acinetobacter soli]|uniref:hypothetical protein n=1 Tax=Acinetobacter soli TaxID=487316 RepID=UPI000F67A4A7|nr:hypothetical protein [Acinetobacter soli]RSB51520.1 hypothetical protein EGK59_13045 [Acinetobacter soli]